MLKLHLRKLAAVSRVVWAERDPETCWNTNVGGLRNVVEAALDRASPPWLVFASSREVYGQSEALPVTEKTPLRPVNVHGCAKIEGERLVEAARDKGLRTAIVRLSSVYGNTHAHADRVVPAFARAAVLGDALRVEGTGHTFDFTHIDDTARGITALVDRLASCEQAPPPIHLLTGQPTTLGQLADLAVRLAGGNASIEQAPARTFDVSRFYGSPAWARELLQWTPCIGIEEGLGRLIDDFRLKLGAHKYQEETT